MAKAKRSTSTRGKAAAGLFDLYTTTDSRGGVAKLRTGIRGFDQMLMGGVPKGRTLLVTGTSGAGKTVLLNEFLYRGLTEYGEPAVFVTFEERPGDIMANLKGFGWDYNPFLKDGRLAFVDLSMTRSDPMVELNEDYDLTPVLLRIRNAIQTVHAKRVVIDSIWALFGRLSNPVAVRNLFHTVCNELRRCGVTALISTEKADGGTAPWRGRVEEYAADGVIELEMEHGQQRMTRRILIRKLRGAPYRSGQVEFEIGPQGLEVYPKLPVVRGQLKSNLSSRRKFMVPGLDEITGGGVPEGHVLLISGETGTGKTTMALQFMDAGVEAGEACVYVALEEPSGQLCRIGRIHGRNYDRAAREGLVTFIDVPLIDIASDKLLCDIVDRALRTGAKRIILDSLSSLLSATMHEQQIRQFLVQLVDFSKAYGITCVLTYLNQGAFGAEKGQLLSHLVVSEMRISSVVDGVILLRYVERGQKVKRLMNVLKLRGSTHDNAIYLFEIGSNGIRVKEKYEE